MVGVDGFHGRAAQHVQYNTEGTACATVARNSMADHGDPLDAPFVPGLVKAVPQAPQLRGTLALATTSTMHIAGIIEVYYSGCFSMLPPHRTKGDLWRSSGSDYEAFPERLDALAEAQNQSAQRVTPLPAACQNLLAKTSGDTRRTINKTVFDYEAQSFRSITEGEVSAHSGIRALQR